MEIINEINWGIKSIIIIYTVNPKNPEIKCEIMSGSNDIVNMYDKLCKRDYSDKKFPYILEFLDILEELNKKIKEIYRQDILLYIDLMRELFEIKSPAEISECGCLMKSFAGITATINDC